MPSSGAGGNNAAAATNGAGAAGADGEKDKKVRVLLSRVYGVLTLSRAATSVSTLRASVTSF